MWLATKLHNRYTITHYGRLILTAARSRCANDISVRLSGLLSLRYAIHVQANSDTSTVHHASVADSSQIRGRKKKKTQCGSFVGCR